MEDNRGRNTVLSWSCIGVAFVAIILFLLYRFVADGRNNAEMQSQERLISYSAMWANDVDNAISIDANVSSMFAKEIADGKSPVDKELLHYAKGIADSTTVSYIVFCENGKLLSCAGPEEHSDLNVSIYIGSESSVLIDKELFDGEDSIVAYTPIEGTGKGVLCVTFISEIEESIDYSPYKEVSFAVIANKNGKILGSFSRFGDADSTYLQNGDLISNIAQGSKSSDYSLMKVKMNSGADAAIKSVYRGDARTISISNMKNADWTVAFGVRQSSVDKHVKALFSAVQATVVKLAIVASVFTIFVISTIVFNSVRTKERGRVLEDKADTDLLTDLNNKAATERKITEYLEENPEGRGMMFILDIDNFKKINDTMGHAFGDTLLKTLGKEIKTEFRMTDIIGRTGGDEFMVFLKDVTDDLIVEREANRITRFFHDFKAGGDYVKYSASASIGAAIFPDDAKNFKDLYIAADQALYRAKKRGKNQLVFYNESLHK